ncbi:MAG: tRNA (N6-isopentenyl adenosine(37)-C2)-methylthiotransferase MiaB [Saprospiraceae bacterium]|nr:tRNA (N6-isopentenyl adenosine(37)-C2)-methylthiotransferase MiaB [Saprospiraceae bacterium]MDP4811847.1 tRNA (N6-isopentenyl adenosine(37)-C2)-methylthiotransferase MiaB [Saprospiraceae bacterium]MDP4914998.1 tRNA (N6-isopentenyl adenosine(37)-C2)-methylthiotransferase MiaB [Saprospiraceae bacterium]MDP5047141.1 tRNA (N6-isopentenyl adenosine(37)-C2)-methylthiotransferase MiaB [Saprospiraceae bacterium]
MATEALTSTDQIILRDPNAYQGHVHEFQDLTNINESARRFYMESYGCQMNFSDSEIVASVLSDAGFVPTRDMEDADLILINTCSIREKAEETVRKRLREFNKVKKYKPGTLIGVLGCMAERLKEKFLQEEKIVDIVVGPDAYRDLPMLVDTAELGEKGINVFLSREETYADISPLRLGSNGISAYISIMRGCDNMCSFCVVPFTRGRERSRDLYSILAEVKDLEQNNYKEITLLGQNVDSYKWVNPENKEIVNFANLLRFVAESAPHVRIRFSTSHPKDITNEVLETIASYDNICKYIHLPVQSGNSRILKMMNRTYDSVWYKERVDAIRRIIPDCAISSDIIVGFCSETEEEFQDTLDMIRYSNYTLCYMYNYSERPGTLAAKKYPDDIPNEVKQRRLAETIVVQRQSSYESNLLDIGKTFEVLIEGDSKKSNQQFAGRNSQNKVIVFRKSSDYKPGDFVMVQVTDVTSGTLLGKLVS